MPADPDPIIADFNTSMLASGKVYQMHHRGQQGPEAICVETDGTPTADPAAFVERGGAILPLGGQHFGFRGTAMALWSEMLTAAVGGTACNPALGNRQSLHLFALHSAVLGDQAAQRAERERLLAHLLSSKPANPAQPLRLPGAAGWQALRSAQVDGLNLDTGTTERLRALSEEFHLAMPAPC